MAAESSSPWSFRGLVASAKRFALNTSPAPMTALFSKTDPDVDGEDCTHDFQT